MIFRALFWIAVIAVLMPHEPDLGLGRPGLRLQDISREAASSQACPEATRSCAAAAGILGALQSAAVRNLAEVKADIEDDERGRQSDD